ncbi:NACHT domain-containing protein [Streptococcus cristatus]|uniref:NACHT domain-containing protein n=1 Tax=Streptococcus cristatus TaxID=45634 RepID=UPI002283ED7B|nr:NACHT domain-containing protein [Streptococcus cristatus]MCY7217142.1 NACHT domain-containing protein [Streptococcus cristatus]
MGFLGLAISALLNNTLIQLKDELVDFGVDNWEKFETGFNKSFTSYFEGSFKRVKNVPFVLSGTNNIDLLSIFQPTYLKSEISHVRCYTADLDNILEKSNNAWIYGYGGIGKSTMLKYFFLKEIEKATSNNNQRIPIYIELRKYNFDTKKRREFLNFIYEEAKVLGFDLEFKYFEYMAKKGRFIFLLDAFDEIASNNMEQAATEIEELATKYSNNPILVTSRKLPFNHINNASLFHPYQTNGLSKDEAIALISRISKLPIAQQKNEVFERFINSLEVELYDEYLSFAENPILLFLMLQMFERNASFPTEKATFIKDSYRLLYKEHDHSKLVALTREFKTDLPESTMMRVISYLCFLTYFENNGGKSEFTESEILSLLDRVLNNEGLSLTRAEDLLADLITCLCIIHKEGQSYYFVHNIFQEFYAANYLYELYDESQEQFFKTAFLAENMNSRLIETTIEYYAELDKEFNKKKLKYNLFLPVLEELKRRNEGRDPLKFYVKNYKLRIDEDGRGDFDEWTPILPDSLVFYLYDNFFKDIPGKLIELPKNLVIEKLYLRTNFSQKIDINSPVGLEFRKYIYRELYKLKSISIKKLLPFIKKQPIREFKIYFDPDTILKNPELYQILIKSTAYEEIKAIEDWVTKTRLEKEADKRKIPILNFKK